jgi:hypothetical protein
MTESGERRAMTGAEFERAVLVTKMLVAAPWLDEERARALIDGTQEERTLIIGARATACVTEGPEVWERVLYVLVLAGTFAGAVSGITSAVQGVYGVGKIL